MRNILRQLGRVMYHFGRSRVDRRHRLKWSTEFAEATAVMDRSHLDKDELADAITDLADDSGYEETALAEATFHLTATGLDEEIPTLLESAIDLADRGLCDLKTAADGVATCVVLFGLDPDEADRVVDSIMHAAIKTPLTAADTIHITTSVGAKVHSLGLEKDIEDVSEDIVDAYRQLDGDGGAADVEMEIRQTLMHQYDREGSA